MYDTYGLHSETIAELAQIESLYFDESDFEEQLNNHKYQTKMGLNKHSTVITKESLGILEKNHVPKTDDSFKYNYTYNGNTYEFPMLNSKLIGIILNGNIKVTYIFLLYILIKLCNSKIEYLFHILQEN